HLSKGLACAECHSVRPGAGQRRQVASPVAAQHNVPAGVSSCAKCHDGTRAFGGDNFAECKRCHTGDTWKF
ncbi:MAG TPA: cytochrome c3 family protein, partial [Blastocatellia bacterium]|nr:cytochrome c3 family protein [Blastocatellia bacterium]